jgi:hypothetical protein
MNECEERCEYEFGRCLRHGDFNECLAHRSSCYRGCGEQPVHPEPEYQCGYGPCPQCMQDYSQSVGCVHPHGHDGEHHCANGHVFSQAGAEPQQEEPAAQPCYSQCGDCESEYAVSNTCAAGAGSHEYHYCTYSHSWY